MRNEGVAITPRSGVNHDGLTTWGVGYACVNRIFNEYRMETGIGDLVPRTGIRPGMIPVKSRWIPGHPELVRLNRGAPPSSLGS